MKRILPWVMSLVLWSCSNPGEPPENEDTSAAQKGIVVGENDATTNGASIFVSIENSDIRKDILEGYVVGLRDSLTLIYNETHQIFQFKQVPEGVYDIILTSQSNDGRPLGRRINGIRVLTRESSLVKDVSLLPLQDLSGEVTLSDSSPGELIRISIPGTDIATNAEEDGTYLVSVPVGIHRLEYSLDGYQTGFISRLDIGDADTHALPPIILGKESSIGIFPISSLNDLTVSFLVNPPANTNEYRISTGPSLSNSEWRKLLSTISFTFEQEGTQTLFIQFAQNGSQLSSVFSSEIEITSQVD